MGNLIKMDVFFFVVTIESIIVTVLFCIVLFYLIKGLRNLYHILEDLKENFKDGEEYVLELRERLENNFIFRFFFPPLRKKKHINKDKKN